ncbi:hypothetical protein JAAARDRAFT_362090 [Jaapia argillacea MUCL 33604]|uniref:cyclin-dependent kinase n=1 Tax=Jaapia argillacea MUCL 33604 TaxID=933084 RepID=A0A067QHK3_9AGAM|nr:hypothetical protein JAAARDRAFT_362090 [Jaapia argillacea MUCL 33604]
MDYDRETVETIHEGPVSMVARARTQTSSTPAWIAIKSATPRREYSQAPHDIIKEIRVLSSISHTNVVEILDHDVPKKHGTSPCRFLMPYVPYRLTDLLASPSFSPHKIISFGPDNPESPQNTRFTILAKSIISQIITGISFLHGSDVAHRDVKPSNVLLTPEGCVKLIDFGIAWKDREDLAIKKNDIWPEHPGQMYFEVGTGPYRAPELLFGPSTYDPFSIDLWSLGTTIAEFFTSLRLVPSEDDSDPDSDSEDEDWPGKAPFIYSGSSALSNTRSQWIRDSLFDSRRGDIGLAWSIFSLRGTPTEDTWPTFSELPDATKVTFKIVPPVDLQPLFPNHPLPEPSHAPSPVMHFPCVEYSLTPFDLIHRFLVYPPSQRLSARDALHHPWFSAGPPLLLLSSLIVNDEPPSSHRHVALWEDKDLGAWMRTYAQPHILNPDPDVAQK